MEHPSEAASSSFLAGVRPRLLGVLHHCGIPPHDAEDLLQQAFLIYLRRAETVREPEAWLAGVLRKQSLLYWRSHRRRLYDAVDPEVLDWLAAPEPAPQRCVEVGQEVAVALAALPPRHQHFAWLRFGLELEPREVAAALGYRASSVSKLASRCRTAMQGRLAAAGWHAHRKG